MKWDELKIYKKSVRKNNFNWEKADVRLFEPLLIIIFLINYFSKLMIHILSAKSKFKILSYCYSSISKLPNDTKLSNIQNLYPLIKKIQS